MELQRKEKDQGFLYVVMEVYDFFSCLKNGYLRHYKAAITVGVFDGVHKAHRKILDVLIEKKNELGLDKAIAISFRTNPKPGVDGELDTIQLRKEFLSQTGVDCLILIDFSPEFSKISASEFVGMLLTITDVATVVVGEDFRFGSPENSAGASDLKRLFLEKGKDIKVFVVGQILTEGGEKISSTLLRRLVKKGKLSDYLMLSDRCYTLYCAGLSVQKKDGTLVFSKKEFTQILPPLGRYRVCLEGKTGESNATLVVDSDSVIIRNLENDIAEFDRIIFSE